VQIVDDSYSVAERAFSPTARECVRRFAAFSMRNVPPPSASNTFHMHIRPDGRVGVF